VGGTLRETADLGFAHPDLNPASATFLNSAAKGVGAMVALWRVTHFVSPDKQENECERQIIWAIADKIGKCEDKSKRSRGSLAALWMTRLVGALGRTKARARAKEGQADAMRVMRGSTSGCGIPSLKGETLRLA
jgi:hypothetical protein